MGRLQEMIASLPEGLSLDDDARHVLEEMLEPIRKIESYTDAKIAGIPKLLQPANAPDAAVPYLAGLVGVGDDLPAAVGTSTAQRRKLAAVAVALWRQKGRSDAWRAIVAALTGRRTVLLDWFALRTTYGSGGEIYLLPSPSSGTYPYAYPEFVTDLWLEDPALALSAAEITQVARWLDVLRGTGERINIRRCLLAEDMLRGMAAWSVAVDDAPGVSTWQYDAAAYTITSTGGRHVAVDLDGAELTWTETGNYLVLAVTGLGVVGVLRQASADGYRVVIDQAGSALHLVRVNLGVPTTLASAVVTLVAGYAYRWRIDTYPTAPSTEIVVRLEGLELIRFVDNNVGRFGSGGLEFFGGTGGGVASLYGAIVAPHSPTLTRVGPST
jgi:hypothetical protein